MSDVRIRFVMLPKVDDVLITSLFLCAKMIAMFVSDIQKCKEVVCM